MFTAKNTRRHPGLVVAPFATLCYKPEIKDLQIAGDWAFEWGYFSYKESANAKPGRGKVLRVITMVVDHQFSFKKERERWGSRGVW
jgi:hypothetical protein